MSLVHMKPNTSVPKGPPPPPQPKTEHNWPVMFKRVHDQLLFERKVKRWDHDGTMRLMLFSHLMIFFSGYMMGVGLYESNLVLWSYIGYVVVVLAMLALIRVIIFSIWGAKWHKLREKPSS